MVPSVNPDINLMKSSPLLYLSFLLFTFTPIASFAEIIEIWPDAVPGQTEAKAEHGILTRDDGSTRVNKVTNPTLEVFLPSEEKRNGAAIIICPGGGYRVLSSVKEGTEVSHYYQDLGYTTFTLLYRVPGNREGALQDVQRAIRYVRGHAEIYQFDPNKVGILGFSAGGHLCVRAGMTEAATYPTQDALDELSVRPDFVAAIYPAYLDKGPDSSLSPELQVSKKLPPYFMAVARDDFKFVNSSLVLASALGKEQLPYELHVFDKAGHGFGMRGSSRAAKEWPRLCDAWMSGVTSKSEQN